MSNPSFPSFSFGSPKSEPKSEPKLEKLDTMPKYEFNDAPNPFIPQPSNTYPFNALPKQVLLNIKDADLVEDDRLADDGHYVFFTGKHDQIKRDGNNKFYYIKVDPLTGDKTEVSLDVGSDKTHEILNKANECYGTYVNDTTGVLCETWFAECINSGDDNQFRNCLSKLAGKNFFDTAKTQIENMHPLIALQILRKFGFRKHEVFDHKANQTLYKVENINHWVKFALKKNNTPIEIQAMLNNPESEQLKRYLDLVSQYVNCNPQILNKNYHGPTDEKVGFFAVPEEAAKLGLKVPTPIPSQYVINPLLSYLIKSKYVPPHLVVAGPPVIMSGGAKPDIYGGHGQYGILSPFGTSTFTPGLPMFRSNNIQKADHGNAQIINAHLNNQGYDIIRDIFKGVIVNLKGKGITVDADSENKLRSMLEQYKNIQDSLLRTLSYMEEYAKYIEQTGNGPSSVNLEMMQKFGDRYGKLNNKYQNLEAKIMADMVDLAVKENLANKKNEYTPF